MKLVFMSNTSTARSFSRQDRRAPFCLITENAEDLIAIVDLQNRRLYSSPSYGRILGYTAEEPKAAESLGQVHQEDRARVMPAKALQETGAGGRPI